MKRRSILAFGAIASLLIGSIGYAGEQRILVQSTTSTQNSGLYDYLIPKFEEKTGMQVAVVAVGTGQAIKNAMNGDADVLLVHAMQSELDFVEQGFGVQRYDVMYNDFVLIGPRDDPAKVGKAQTVDAALSALQDTGQRFISRGDDSGTHKKELRLWKAANLEPAGQWYVETGSGMGATIRMAVEMNGYTLTDRATWIAFNAKEDHRILLSGQSELFNQYGVIAVNPDKHPHVNKTGSNAFIAWLLSSHGQQLIAEFKVQGQQLFFPNAHKTASN
ncbi:MAG: substrate-binding domain-containing protein [Proteobacteria bacterium]|nr:substrate-binding domain-containing protein [Pseudomonadota bacterium]